MSVTVFLYCTKWMLLPDSLFIFSYLEHTEAKVIPMCPSLMIRQRTLRNDGLPTTELILIYTVVVSDVDVTVACWLHYVGVSEHKFHDICFVCFRQLNNRLYYDVKIKKRVNEGTHARAHTTHYTQYIRTYNSSSVVSKQKDILLVQSEKV